jgi:thiol-disulfide isomerase/thioredoxin
MKHIIFTIVIVVFSLVVLAQESTFQGEINGIDSAEINLVILPLKFGEKPISDKIQCVNGKFEYKIKFNTNMWHLVRLRSSEFISVFGNEKLSTRKLKNREITFFIYPNDQISIVGNIAEYGIDYKVLGNDINNQRNQVSEILFPLEEEFNRLTISYKKVDSEDEKDKEFETQINSINQKMDSIRLKLIVEHPDWIYSAETIAGFPEDTIAKYFKSFTTDVQNSFFGIHLSKILNAAEIGSLAPEFSLRNIEGENVQLNDFKGKFVVLDFWGTWCGYCIKGIPRMKEYHSKYQDKIEFVSVACRDNKQTWLKAIAKYDLNWINLLAENEEITDKYGVEGYPTKIIIDKEGKIAWKSTGEIDEFYEKMDEMFK